MDNIFYSLTVLICSKKGEFVIFDFLKVRLKPRYFTSSWCNFYENWQVLPGNLVQTYSIIFSNLKVWLSRKCKNKSVGVRKVVRYNVDEKGGTEERAIFRAHFYQNIHIIKKKESMVTVSTGNSIKNTISDSGSISNVLISIFFLDRDT